MARGASIVDFAEALAASGTQDIVANLHYVDYLRAKRRAEEG